MLVAGGAGDEGVEGRAEVGEDEGEVGVDFITRCFFLGFRLGGGLGWRGRCGWWFGEDVSISGGSWWWWWWW